MKKSLIVLSLAMVMVFAFATAAMAYGPFTTGAYNANYAGYLSWGAAAVAEPTNGSSPHGNYTTSTNKCAVCHSVHKADTAIGGDGVAGRVLTAWPGMSGSAVGNDMFPYQSCQWCHGTSSPLFAVSTIGDSATLAPHGYCGRCHTASVHGAGGSIYPVLKAKLLNTKGDAGITADLAAIQTNVSLPMLTNTTDGAMAVGTGYLCGSSGCHTGDVAFPVTASGMRPSQGAAPSNKTGHRIIAAVSTTWNEDGTKGAYYSGLTAAANDSQVAWNPATGCKSCHDARLGNQTTGAFAFPHNYVNAAGVATGNKDAGASYVWLTTGADSAAARAVAVKTQNTNGDIVGTEDGLCLKCHKSSNGTDGVGQTF